MPRDVNVVTLSVILTAERLTGVAPAPSVLTLR